MPTRIPIDLEEAARKLKSNGQFHIISKRRPDGDGEEQGKKGKNRPQDKRHRAAKDERRAEGVQAAAAITPAGDGPKEEKGGKQVESKTPQITRIAPHDRPVHLDEATIIGLIGRFSVQAENTWPGSTTAKVRPLESGEDPFAIIADPTVLKLGWGGIEGSSNPWHIIDEHNLPRAERERQCAATLAATALDLDDMTMFLLKRFLDMVLRSDKITPEYGHLADLVMHSLPGLDTAKLVTSAMEASMQRQQAFVDAAKLLLPKAKISQLPDGGGEIFSFEGIGPIPEDAKSDREEIRLALPAAARAAGAAIIIIENPDGHIQILGGNKAQRNLDMRRAAVLVRLKEFSLRGNKSTPALAILSGTGTFQEWHLTPAGDLLNGLRNHKTVLSMGDIKRFLNEAFDNTWWNNWTGKYFIGQRLAA